MTHKASVGRIVHYYQGDYEAPTPYHNPLGKKSDEAEEKYLAESRSAWRGTNGTRIHPAVITHVHTDTCVNLMVLWDAGTPSAKTSMTNLPDEVFAEGMHCTNSGWRWPERV